MGKEILVRPKPIDDVLSNPFKGFLAYADTFYADPVIPQTLVYDEVTWAELEPKAPGRIEWEALERDWDRHLKLGRKIGFRFHTATPGHAQKVNIPDWLVKRGVGLGDYLIDGDTGKAPDWDHPIFLKEHDRIIAAMGKRYNKDPRVAWIDVGSYGLWGEWHVWAEEGVPEAQKNKKLAATEATKKRILDAYIKAFPDKRMVIAFDDEFATKYLTTRGGGIRDDCLGKEEENNWYLESMTKISPKLIDEHYKMAIITGEFCGSEQGALDGIMKRWDLNFSFIQKTHWSWIGPAGGDLVMSEGDVLKRAKILHKKLGYRFRFSEFRYPDKIKVKGNLKLKAKVVNEGVAPFYYPWPTAIAFKRVSRRVSHLHYEMKVKDPEWDCRNWLPGEHDLVLNISLPPESKLGPGAYDVFISILDPSTGKPGVNLAMTGRDSEGRYKIGRVRVVP